MKATTTREAVNKLTNDQRAYLERIVYIANYCENVYAEKEKIRCKIEGYCQCLKDIGALTENERRMVYLYYRSKIAYESDKNKKQCLYINHLLQPIRSVAPRGQKKR